MRVRSSFLLIILAGFFTGCQWFETKSSDQKIARVGEEFLYQSDIDELTFELNSEDSAELAKNFIDGWIKERLLLQKAKQNLSESQIDFEKQLENYRKSLIIYAYENKLIKQKLDTLVSPEQCRAYYLQNQGNFELKQDVLIVQLVKCLNSAPNQDSIPYWMGLKQELSEEKLSQYCAQFTLRCDIDTSNWISRTMLEGILPKGVDPSKISYRSNEIEIHSDSLETFYLKTLNFKRKGNPAPLAYVSDQISEIVRNKRRLELLSRVKEEIFEEATLKRKYEVYSLD